VASFAQLITMCHASKLAEAPRISAPFQELRNSSASVCRVQEGGLPEAVRRPLVAAGATVVPALIALVEDHADLGWAPLQAVDLLGALGNATAVPVLLRCLDQEDALDLLVQQAAAALRTLGILAFDSCLLAYATTPRDAFRARLAGVMSRWGLHDERLYAVLAPHYGEAQAGPERALLVWEWQEV
jgi:hypothetical protein